MNPAQSSRPRARREGGPAGRGEPSLSSSFPLRGRGCRLAAAASAEQAKEAGRGRRRRCETRRGRSSARPAGEVSLPGVRASRQHRTGGTGAASSVQLTRPWSGPRGPQAWLRPPGPPSSCPQGPTLPFLAVRAEGRGAGRWRWRGNRVHAELGARQCARRSRALPCLTLGTSPRETSCAPHSMEQGELGSPHVVASPVTGK